MLHSIILPGISYRLREEMGKQGYAESSLCWLTHMPVMGSLSNSEFNDFMVIT